MSEGLLRPPRSSRISYLVYSYDCCSIPLLLKLCNVLTSRVGKGEKLRMKICGFDKSTFPAVDQATLEVDADDNENSNFGVGSVTVQCGLHDGVGSDIVLPVIDFA